MTKIKRISVENLKAVSKQSADFNGMTAIITAGNNKGKTSFLRSLVDRLRGTKPDAIVKNGEEKGFYEMELTTGEKFLWNFDSKGREKLTYTSERNIPGSVTKGIMAHYFPPVFDIDKFLESGPKKQQNELQKISGIDFTEWQKEYTEAFQQRTFQNKLVETEKARLLTYDPDLPVELLAMDHLQTELNGIEAHNLRYQQRQDGVESRRKQSETLLEEIKQLQDQIAAKIKQSEMLHSDMEKVVEWMKKPENQPKTNAAQLQKDVADIKKVNTNIAENNTAKKQQDIYETAVKNAAAADKLVKQLETDKSEMLKHSSLPEGFGFSDEGITYNGFEFTREQLSSSGLTIAALKLATLGLGEVRTLHFDASFLDKNNLMEVEKWANANNLQLLIERPSYEASEISYEIIAAG